MFGDNPIRKQDLTAEGLLVKDIFYTIQGEGPYAGRPAVFVRLIGCNLRCWFCDTDFESDPRRMSIDDIVFKIQAEPFYPHAYPLVVITGGEPFLQGALLNLVEALTKAPYQVQIETNGILWIDGLDTYVKKNNLSIIVSPKTSKLHSMIQLYAHAFKYIIEANSMDIIDGLPVLSTQDKDKKNRLARPINKDALIYVQPMDQSRGNACSMNLLHKKETARIAMKYGYQVSFQMHKYLGVE